MHALRSSVTLYSPANASGYAAGFQQEGTLIFQNLPADSSTCGYREVRPSGPESEEEQSSHSCGRITPHSLARVAATLEQTVRAGREVSAGDLADRADGKLGDLFIGVSILAEVKLAPVLHTA